MSATRLELAPSGRVALLLALGAGAAALFEPGLARPLAALSAGTLGLAALLARRALAGLELGPLGPARAAVGARVELHGTLRAHRPWRGSWSFALAQNAGESPLPAGRASGTLTPAGATLALAWRLRSRGRTRALELVVAARDPLGLVQAVQRRPLACDLLGLPRRGELVGELARAGAQHAAVRGRAARGDDELVTVRDWRPGESLRRLHWRLSARRGRAIVRELAAPTQGALEVVLDTTLAAPDERARRAAFERAVSLCATLLEHHLRAGQPVTLRLGQGGAAQRLRGRAGLARGLALLAEAVPVPAPPAPTELRRARPARRLVVRAGRGLAPPAPDAETRILDVDARPGEPHHAPWRPVRARPGELR